MAESKHTPLPWKWYQEDGSFWGLSGPADERDHVLWSEICQACQERGAICTAPKKADRDFIETACNSHYALRETNSRLNRRCQQLESIVHKKREWDHGLFDATEEFFRKDKTAPEPIPGNHHPDESLDPLFQAYIGALEALSHE